VTGELKWHNFGKNQILFAFVLHRNQYSKYNIAASQLWRWRKNLGAQTLKTLIP
jgi:hypothetical protein